MPRLLVIRFGALGDLCLLAWSLAALATNDTSRPRVTLVTKAAFADLFGRVPGVDEVVPLAGSRPADLLDLARRLRTSSFDHMIDAHNNLRSRMLLLLLGKRPQRRLAKDTAARLAFLLRRRRAAALDRTMRNRFDELLQVWLPHHGHADPGEGGANRREVGLLHASPPLSGLAVTARPETEILGIAPGAHWDTKRWPESHFCAFLRLFREVSSAPVRLFVGPREESWFPGGALARLTTDLGGVTVWRQRSLVELAAGLSECATLVTNDSGLLHLAEAVGTPVVALFGPTVAEFGYFPSLPASRTLQVELECRPCSRNGKRPCHRHDLACLVQITPEQLLTELLCNVPWAAGTERKGRGA